MKLSKTDFLIYRECAHNAWLKLHKPDIYGKNQISEFDRSLIETGNEVDVLARVLFPGGVLLARGDTAGTARLIGDRAPVLYQPVFETEQFITACDVLVWDAQWQVYDLYEVKSSSNGGDHAKDNLYVADLAFQVEMLWASGVPLGQQFLVRLDTGYVRGDRLDIQALFASEDFSERVDKVRDAIAAEMASAHAVLQSENELVAPCSCMLKGRSAHCTTFWHTNPTVPQYSVHDIARIGSSKSKLIDLTDRGVVAITDVPDGFVLSDVQDNQVRAVKSGRAIIDEVAISDFLGAMQYPLAFLDYETYPCAVPRLAGYHPYEQIPFQFSLDVIDRPRGEMAHHEFLWTEATTPDAALIAELRKAVPATGAVIVWNKTFERGINERLAARNPEARDFLTAVNARLVDLMEVFATQAYVHPDFRGKTSIKNVLPVLVPAFSYKDLAIQEGTTATVKWNGIVTRQLDVATVAQTRSDLLAYCGLDTRAMVEIWRVLVDVAAGLREGSENDQGGQWATHSVAESAPEIL